MFLAFQANNHPFWRARVIQACSWQHLTPNPVHTNQWLRLESQNFWPSYPGHGFYTYTKAYTHVRALTHTRVHTQTSHQLPQNNISLYGGLTIGEISQWCGTVLGPGIASCKKHTQSLKTETLQQGTTKTVMLYPMKIVYDKYPSVLLESLVFLANF